jgi:hypothetical protein
MPAISQQGQSAALLFGVVLAMGQSHFLAV